MTSKVVPLKRANKNDVRLIAGIYITDDTIYAATAWVDSRLVPFGRYRPIILDPHFEIPIEVGRDRERAIQGIRSLAAKLADFFIDIEAIGIGCFGPFETIDPSERPSYEDLTERDHEFAYGRIRESSIHTHLGGVNVYALVAKQFARKNKRPDIRIQTDVAVSAFAECVEEQHARFRQFAKRRKQSNPALGPIELLKEFEGYKPARTWIDRHVLVCFKISVGAGGAVISQREFWPPNRYSEMGHIHIDAHKGELLHRSEDEVHKRFLEAYVSEQAVSDRLALMNEKRSLGSVRKDDRHPVWSIVSYYIAQVCIAATMTASPDKIVLTGRLMRSKGLVKRVQAAYRELYKREGVAPYISHPPSGDVRKYIGAPSIEKPGILGSLFLAAQYLGKE